MSAAGLEEARRLAEWKPRLGVLSVFVRHDPADRGGGWRTELRNGLAAVLGGGDGLGHDAAAALRATAERVAGRFADHDRDLPRGELGFVEVAAKRGAESWWASHVEPAAPAPVVFDRRPLVAPLVAVLERGSPRGAALVSAERVRLFEAAAGRLEEVEAWELSVFSRDWRERKAARTPDPARAQAVGASGRDRFEERMEENRHRFLARCGALAGATAARRGWPQVLLFGSAEQRRELRQGLRTPGVAPVEGGDADLISEPPGRLAGAIEEAARRLDAERERELARRAIEGAEAGGRGASGRAETARAVSEGRVETLVLDAERATEHERLVKGALESGAAVTTVGEAAAAALAGADGVAAILRY